MGAACSLGRKAPLMIDVAPVPGQGSQLPSEVQEVAVHADSGGPNPPASPGPTAAVPSAEATTQACASSADSTRGALTPSPGHIATPRVKKEVTVGGDVPIQSELKPHDWLAEVCPGSNDRRTQPDSQDSAPAAVECKLERRPTIEPKDWLTELGKGRQQKTPEAPEPTKKRSTFRRRRLSMTRTADPASADAAAAASAAASQDAPAPTVANKLSTFRRCRLSMTRTADPASADAAAATTDRTRARCDSVPGSRACIAQCATPPRAPPTSASLPAASGV